MPWVIDSMAFSCVELNWPRRPRKRLTSCWRTSSKCCFSEASLPLPRLPVQGERAFGLQPMLIQRWRSCGSGLALLSGRESIWGNGNSGSECQCGDKVDSGGCRRKACLPPCWHVASEEQGTIAVRLWWEQWKVVGSKADGIPNSQTFPRLNCCSSVLNHDPEFFILPDLRDLKKRIHNQAEF